MKPRREQIRKFSPYRIVFRTGSILVKTGSDQNQFEEWKRTYRNRIVTRLGETGLNWFGRNPIETGSDQTGSGTVETGLDFLWAKFLFGRVKGMSY